MLVFAQPFDILHILAYSMKNVYQCKHFYIFIYPSRYLHWRFLTTEFLSSLAIFSAVIVVSLPDYLSPDVLDLDAIVPSCGQQFKGTVKQVAEFAIGLLFACLFTVQICPILVSNSMQNISGVGMVLLDHWRMHHLTFLQMSSHRIPS